MPCRIEGADDYDFSYFERKITPVARKEHLCEECNSIIQPGQKYERVFSVSDGLCWTIKTCLPCVEIRDEFFESYCYGNMWETMREECGGNIEIGQLDRLSPDAAGKLEDFFREDWDEQWEDDKAAECNS